jgi:hypothetical protein
MLKPLVTTEGENLMKYISKPNVANFDARPLVACNEIANLFLDYLDHNPKITNFIKEWKPGSHGNFSIGHITYNFFCSTSMNYETYKRIFENTNQTVEEVTKNIKFDITLKPGTIVVYKVQNKAELQVFFYNPENPRNSKLQTLTKEANGWTLYKHNDKTAETFYTRGHVYWSLAPVQETDEERKKRVRAEEDAEADYFMERELNRMFAERYGFPGPESKRPKEVNKEAKIKKVIGITQYEHEVQKTLVQSYMNSVTHKQAQSKGGKAHGYKALIEFIGDSYNKDIKNLIDVYKILKSKNWTKDSYKTFKRSIIKTGLFEFDCASLYVKVSLITDEDVVASAQASIQAAVMEDIIPFKVEEVNEFAAPVEEEIPTNIFNEETQPQYKIRKTLKKTFDVKEEEVVEVEEEVEEITSSYNSLGDMSPSINTYIYNNKNNLNLNNKSIFILEDRVQKIIIKKPDRPEKNELNEEYEKYVAGCYTISDALSYEEWKDYQSEGYISDYEKDHRHNRKSTANKIAAYF